MTTKKTDDERQAALQNETDTVPLEVSEEVFDGSGPLHVKVTKKSGLPDDEPLRRSITDTDLVIGEVTSRQWRRQWDVDEDGVEKTGSERWVEVTRRNAGVELDEDGNLPGAPGGEYVSEEAPVPAAEGADERAAREAAEAKEK